MSCLSLIQDAAEELGLDSPSVVFSSLDPNVVLLRRLAQKAGKLIAERHDWQALLTQHTWTSAATEAQPLAFPADFDRMNYMSDVWDRSTNLRYLGPSNVKDWQYFKNGVVSGATGVIGYWRIIGGQLNLFPAPAAGNTMALEYITKKWAKDNGGTPTTSGKFEADTDEARIPEALITAEIIWRFKHRNGLDYAEDMSDAERAIERATSRDRGVNVIAVGGGEDVRSQALTWPGVITS